MPTCTVSIYRTRLLVQIVIGIRVRVYVHEYATLYMHVLVVDLLGTPTRYTVSHATLPLHVAVQAVSVVSLTGVEFNQARHGLQGTAAGSKAGRMM